MAGNGFNSEVEVLGAEVRGDSETTEFNHSFERHLRCLALGLDGSLGNGGEAFLSVGD